MDFANLKHLPQLASRPNFPQGLQVLLLDPDHSARAEADSQLRQCGYAVAQCSSSAEAATYLSNPEHSVDVLLLDVKSLQLKTAENATLLAAAKLLPLVLMAEASDPAEVMLGIKLGAVDFLEKPLALLKLKNIWQHTVRRMMGAPAGTNNLHLMKKGAHPQQLQHLVSQQQSLQGPSQQGQQQTTAPLQHNMLGVAAAATANASSPEDSSAGSHGSHGSGGESGSNASTSDRAHVKAEMDMDIETSSFRDLAGGSLLMGSAEALHNMALSMPRSCVGPDAMDCEAPATSNTSNQSSRQLRSPRSKQAQSQAGKPAIGYPAGQMPNLPNVPGIEWGLPTNPLQISPKNPGAMGGMAGMMGAFGMPGSLFPPFLFGGSPMGGSMGHLGGSMSTVASASSLMNLPQISSISAPQCVPNTCGMMKRAESAPPSLVNFDHFLAPSSVTGATNNSNGSGSCNMNNMHASPSSVACNGNSNSCLADASMDGAAQKAVPFNSDIFLNVDAVKPSPPPIGLQLKKSPSLVDFISCSLKQGGSPDS